MTMSMEPCFPSSLGFYRKRVRRHTPVSLRYWRMQYVISSLCYCLNIGYMTSKLLQETLCTPTSLRQQSNDVFPLYAVHMEDGTILWIGCAVSRGWWLPSHSKKNDCSYFSTWTPSRCVVGGWMCCVLKTTWQTPVLKAIWWSGTTLTTMDHEQQTQLKAGIINFTGCVGAPTQMCTCSSSFFKWNKQPTKQRWSSLLQVA